jgi:hypothetical protein
MNTGEFTMTEERLFNSTIKVVTRSYGISNDPSVAGGNYAVDGFAPRDAKIFLLSRSRFVTSGGATFLVGLPEVNWAGVVYPMVPDSDMDAATLPTTEIWINARDIISIVEEA